MNDFINSGNAGGYGGMVLKDNGYGDFGNKRNSQTSVAAGTTPDRAKRNSDPTMVGSGSPKASEAAKRSSADSPGSGSGVRR